MFPHGAHIISCGRTSLYLLGLVFHYFLGGFEDKWPDGVELQTVLLKDIGSNGVEMVREIAGKSGGDLQRKALLTITSENTLGQGDCQGLQCVQDRFARCFRRDWDCVNADIVGRLKGL